MKKLAIITIATIMMVSCDSLPRNPYLGRLPALYAEEENALKNLQDQSKDGRYGYREKLDRIDRIEKKYEKERKAEIATIDRRYVPFACSKSFEELNFEVKWVAFSGPGEGYHLGLNISLRTKQDFVVNTKNISDYSKVWYRIVAKDGSTIRKSVLSNPAYIVSQGKHITKDESLGYFSYELLTIFNQPKCWVDFAGIEFITRDEWNNIPEEATCIRIERLY